MEENIIIYSQRLEEKIKEEMGEDATPELLNLIRAAIPTHEHAFQKYEMIKEKYLEWIDFVWGIGKGQIRICDREEMGEDATPESLNLIRAAISTQEHVFQKHEITKEKYLEWINLAWDMGEGQRRIYDGKEEGGIMNTIGLAMALGGHLAIFGQRKGYINQKKE